MSEANSARISDPAPPEAPRSGMKSKLAKLISPYSHSPWPAWSLSALFLGTSMVGLSAVTTLPPFAMRFGFGSIFAGAGYVLSTGDVQNGSGITTAWSAIYLVGSQLRQIGLTKCDRAPRVPTRHPLALALTGATLLSTAIYGGEYFWFQNYDEAPK